jgi:hypothetical protein
MGTMTPSARPEFARWAVDLYGHLIPGANSTAANRLEANILAD